MLCYDMLLCYDYYYVYNYLLLCLLLCILHCWYLILCYLLCYVMLCHCHLLFVMHLPPAGRGNRRIYAPLPPAVRKRRTNEAAPVCPWAAELMANVNSDYLITVSSNAVMR